MVGRTAAAPEAMASSNEVRLVGSVGAAPQVRDLPSGDRLVVSRLVVRRDVPQRPRRPSRQSVDVVDCAGWEPRVRRSMSGWREGDLVEVRGALRRRFFRSGGQTASRVEIEVISTRVVRRAARE